jgi:hypothetical protein
MKTLLISTLLAGLLASASVFAVPPAGAPAGTMGICNDGSYSSSAEKKGACRGHQGLKEWYGVTAPVDGATTSTTTTPAQSATTTTKTATTTLGGKTAPAPVSQPAPGGGAGKVWVNTSTKVYHCSGDKYFGTTKHGEYMSEADAKSKGYHADHGKACG